MRCDYNELISKISRWDQPTRTKSEGIYYKLEPKCCTNKSWVSQTHKKHHGLNLKRNHYFLSYNMLCGQWQGLHQNDKKFHGSKKRILIFLNFTNTWVLQLLQVHNLWKLLNQSSYAFEDIVPMMYGLFNSKVV